MREAGARGQHFIAHCVRCLLASPPLPAPKQRAERRVRALGWTKTGEQDWCCPRCIVRDVDVFFDDPRGAMSMVPPAGDAIVRRTQAHVVRITCARSPVIMPEGALGLARFDRWVAGLPNLARSAGALKRTLVVGMGAYARLPSGLVRATPRAGSIEFDQFDEDELVLVRLRWEIDALATLRPDARTLRWICMRQTLASTTDDGAVAFDVAAAEGWLVSP